MKLIVQIVFVDLFPSKATVARTVPSKSNKTQALTCKDCYEYTVVFFFSQSLDSAYKSVVKPGQNPQCSGLQKWPEAHPCVNGDKLEGE